MKRKVMVLSLLPLLALTLVSVALLKPTGTHAANVRMLKGHSLGTKLYSRHSSTVSNLVYNGGSEMDGTTQVYAIFWEPTHSYVSKTYNSLILRYFGDVGGSSLYANNTQYTDSSGSAPSNATLGGYWVDTSKYPSKRLSDTQIQLEVSRALQKKGWTSGLNHVFFVFTARGENICVGSQCSFSTFCAYHSYAGSNTIYAVMPYTGTNLAACGVRNSPNNDFDADSTINVTSHEQMEAATDPLLNAWYDRSGNEIGDKCAWTFGPLNAQGGDVLWNNHAYEVQEEWDNAKSGCVIAGP